MTLIVLVVVLPLDRGASVVPLFAVASPSLDHRNHRRSVHKRRRFRCILSQNVTIDLGSAVPVGALKLRHYTSDYSSKVMRVELQYAVSPTSPWLDVPFSADESVAKEALRTPNYFGAELAVSPVVSARFLRLSQLIRPGVEGSVCVAHFWAWDEQGPFGLWPGSGSNGNHPGSNGSLTSPSVNGYITKRDRAEAQHHPLASMLGVNGIWGWGSNSFSNSQGGFVEGEPTLQWGPYRYSGLASHGRNYHNWVWDGLSPQTLQV